MEKVSNFFKYVAACGGSLWFGAELSRLTLTFYLFQGNQFELKPFVDEAFLQPVFYVMNPLLILTSIAYSVFFVSFLIYILTTSLKLRANGWLFIILVLVVTLSPFEFYLIKKDYQILTLVFTGKILSKDVLYLVITRFKVLGSFPLIHLFSFMAIIYLAIFQPLKKNEN